MQSIIIHILLSKFLKLSLQFLSKIHCLESIHNFNLHYNDSVIQWSISWVQMTDSADDWHLVLKFNSLTQWPTSWVQITALMIKFNYSNYWFTELTDSKFWFLSYTVSVICDQLTNCWLTYWLNDLIASMIQFIQKFNFFIVQITKSVTLIINSAVLFNDTIHKFNSLIQ